MKLPPRPAFLSKLPSWLGWVLLNLLFLAGLGFFTYQIVSSGAGEGARALEQGRKLIVDLETGETAGFQKQKEEGEESAKEGDSPMLAPVKRGEGETGLPGTGKKPADHVKLAPAPGPGMVEETPEGKLPIISEDGKIPMKYYARRSSSPDNMPTVALVIGGLGLTKTSGDEALKLPGEVTFSIIPFTAKVGEWVEILRGAGHEILLNVAMQPAAYPADDPGPNALLTELPPEEIVKRLDWHLMRASGYIGISSDPEEVFTSSPKALTPVLESVSKRGLLFFYDKLEGKESFAELAKAMKVKALVPDAMLDEMLTEEAIRSKLDGLEKVARARGFAIGTGNAYPITVKTILAWKEGLRERGIALVPLSYVAEHQ